MADQESPQEKAQKLVYKIVDQAVRKALPPLPNMQSFEYEAMLRDEAGRYSKAFFADPSDKDAARTRMEAMAITMALNPQVPENHPVWEVLDKAGLNPGYIRDNAMRDDFGRPYTGGGWSESEKQGRTPGSWELSPGDYLAYQRQLDHDTLGSIAEASRLTHAAKFAPTGYGADAYARSFANSQMQKAVKSYEDSQGNRDASSFFGSTYPQHQGGAAIRDALMSHSSPIGNYIQKGQFTADAAAHLAMSKGDPLNQAAVTYEGDYQWNRPSPHFVPEGTAAERDAYIARARELTDQTRPPNYSLSYAREHGQPPSYAWQGAMNFLNNLADLSLPAMFAGGKAVNAAAKGLAKTGIPLASRYGAHIARKTEPIAAATAGAFAARETMEDGMFLGAMQGATTAADKHRPAFFFPGLRGLPSAWQGGWANRPDLLEGLRSEGVSPPSNDPSQVPSRSQMLTGTFKDLYDRQAEQRERAAKELAEMNRRSPESFDKGTGQIGAAIGDAVGTAYGNIPAPPKQPRYTPPAWGPFLTR